MRGKLLVLVLVLSMTPSANALMVRLSLDGVNPAPEEIDVVAGEILGMYVISDSDGVSYWEELYDVGIATISNVQSYTAAGDLADITDFGGHFKLIADDSGSNIQAGIHFSFDLTIAPDAIQGDHRNFDMFNGPNPDDTIRLTVVPEPGTVFLLALGGVFLLKRQRSEVR